MEFKKTVMFLGVKRRSGEKGVTYVVDMFCPGGDSWQFFIKDTPDNNAMIGYLMRAACGCMVDASFRVGQYGKDTYVRLVGVEDAA